MILNPPKLTRRARHEKIKKRVFGHTHESLTEFVACSPVAKQRGFVRWCERHVKIQDRETGGVVPFRLFPGQMRVVPVLVSGKWLLALKGRQLGFTWLAAAYTLWKITYTPTFVCAVINQERQYANDFLRRVLWIYDRMDARMRTQITQESKQELRFEANGHMAEIRSLVGSDRAARSLTADLVVFDEASRIPDLHESLAAVQPAIEVTGGQLIVLSTSAGPSGAFYELWHDTYGESGEGLDGDRIGKTGFCPVFIHWSERPGRDSTWYEEQKERLKHISPVAIKQEYPDNPQEAWEHAAGRVFPLFTRERNVGDMEVPFDADRYRGIDWGMTKSAHVVLWVAHFPGEPGLLISPKCRNTIREFLGYIWDEARPEHPVKKDDHTIDALRYIVTTYNLTGTVYVYREIYRTDSVQKGWNPAMEAAEIHEASGWVEAPPESRARWRRGREGEEYIGTVADRSWTKMIELFNSWDIPCEPHSIFRSVKGTDGKTDSPRQEKLEGLRMLSALIDASIDLDKRFVISRQEALVRNYYEDRRVRGWASMPLERRREHQLAREILRARRRKT